MSKGKTGGWGKKPPPWGKWSGNDDGKNQYHQSRGVSLVLPISEPKLPADINDSSNMFECPAAVINIYKIRALQLARQPETISLIWSVFRSVRQEPLLNVSTPNIKYMNTSGTKSELSDDEQRGVKLIHETGGIHQSDFWKQLDYTSRKGSRIVESLLNDELIERFEAVYNGQRTYFLEPKAKNLDFRLLMAGDMLSPFIGNEEVDPQSDTFTQWLMQLSYDEWYKISRLLFDGRRLLI